MNECAIPAVPNDFVIIYFSKIEEHIRDKYQWKKYCMDSAIPDPNTIVLVRIYFCCHSARGVIHEY